MKEEIVIEVENLRVDFENVVACKNVNFKVYKGEIFGLVGPNGAGKTTTLKVLSTLLKYTWGKIKIFGYDIEKDFKEIRKIVGFMPDFPPVYNELKVWEFLYLYASSYRIEKEKRMSRIEALLNTFNLFEKRNSFIGELSRGMKQRLILAKTLIHDPEILLLDEPASGLDPTGRKELGEMLKKIGKSGKTVIISSHILTELADFCTSVGIMEKGEILLYGKIDEISGIPKDKTLIRLRIKENIDLKEILGDYQKIEKIEKIEGNCWKILIKGDENSIPELIKFVTDKGISIVEIKKEKEDIQTIYFKSGAKYVT
ncbi:MAG: ABC transporter ATP-binding protein [Candidatus Omnitrophica bacterium]|nr:ABC transporter ATP-binding protein [Candidatus Omnitrophota bacterium]MCM8806598.1 ABC transporter ATP-binding protein [Candidatus Omnitrophota bacterium]